MNYKEELLEALQNQLSYENQLQEQLEEKFKDGANRKNQIIFIETAIADIDVLFASLKRLSNLAKNDTGGSRVAGQFLLNVYNKEYSHFDLRELNNLDNSYWTDAINILKLDRLNYVEIHEYLEGGEELFHTFVDSWQNT